VEEGKIERRRGKGKRRKYGGIGKRGKIGEMKGGGKKAGFWRRKSGGSGFLDPDKKVGKFFRTGLKTMPGQCKIDFIELLI
jgi:hypothetical protein